MLIVDIVLETADTTGFTLWPVAGLPPYRPLALSGRMTPDEVGSAMAALARHTVGASDDDPPAPDAAALVRRMLAEEEISVDGGLRFRHTGLDVTVNPGCCCGLRDWRDWSGLVTDGEVPWLGHDPTPRVELAEATVRLWPDGGFAAEPPPTRPVRIPVADLPGILRSVQDDLRGFLGLVERWAARRVPDQARELTDRLDADLAVTAPLPGRHTGGLAQVV
ncbi:hypothetical protein [Streptomyces mobaraensis]|uniref:Uncharacterized protein n=1 Tax=Streptomyces mobaraensis TaxID=35621 RepID=A0A5N5W9V5_STRMB|nr:hypothetical protein [Streptomyces mobaraensis]KAB7847293.1 hypothetical protein FRZ00_11345 [Streptomyces mobaraensis]